MIAVLSFIGSALRTSETQQNLSVRMKPPPPPPYKHVCNCLFPSYAHENQLIHCTAMIEVRVRSALSQP